MITLHNGRVILHSGIPCAAGEGPAGEGTITRSILNAHTASRSPSGLYRLRFDSLISHDITYVGIIQTARASGLERFPLPYVLTNCHNSLCAVGGTINEDDHAYGLSAARRYGGIYVPSNQAVIHQYAREALCRTGNMILGSDSHTRYGPLGVMGIGEGGPELVKQLLSDTYDLPEPEVVLVYLTNTPPHGVGPHDVALSLAAAVYENGFVKNRALEFAGPGISALAMDFRFGIDVMTTETGALTSVWETDLAAESYFRRVGRPEDFKRLCPQEGAAYHRLITIDLAKARPMIALPFHPSNALPIRDANDHAGDILRGVEKDAAKRFGAGAALKLTGKIRHNRILVDQGVIAGCAGGMYDTIREAAAVLEGGSIGASAFSLSVYPSSMPVALELMERGVQRRLIEAGAVFKPCFCGPCFGAGDVPGHNALSVRHTTRNFPHREGSRPADGQAAAAALMDGRSIAATARAQGLLTGADELDYTAEAGEPPRFNQKIYANRVYQGFGSPLPEEPLRFGPNIADWPRIEPLGENLLLCLASIIRDPVTTTDELIPSGEASSYRSNPRKLAGFTLSRRDPSYVPRAEGIQSLEEARKSGAVPQEAAAALARLGAGGVPAGALQIGSAVFALKIGDGSAREQAASCQRVLGGSANICYEYATKRYRANLINWGILPFMIEEGADFEAAAGDWLYVPDAASGIASGAEDFPARLLTGGAVRDLLLRTGRLAREEREIIRSGCLINYYAGRLSLNGGR
ncbi:MAG: hydratase [Spirochaetaceae bacterium]|jgi:aconitate hydratase|nr:hydratase [Spirochaetaceae bacterium]